MAMVIITIQDQPDGHVAVRMHAEPAVNTIGKPEFTPAQRMGAVALNAVQATLQAEKPRIILAGADELLN